MRTLAGAPARTGIHPRRTCSARCRTRLPRTHGDDPTMCSTISFGVNATPRARGSTPLRWLGPAEVAALPRAHGDKPFAEQELTALPGGPPRARGSTSFTRGCFALMWAPRRAQGARETSSTATIAAGGSPASRRGTIQPRFRLLKGDVRPGTSGDQPDDEAARSVAYPPAPLGGISPIAQRQAAR